MKVAFYKGKSLTSKLIKWKTRGPYSHASIIFGNGDILEAWESTNSVRYIKNLSDGHTPGTEVDIFDITLPVDETAARAFADAQLGKKYEYRLIAKFITNTNGNNPDKWVCSEISLELVAHGGVSLLERVPAYKVSPVTLSWSPLLKFDKTVITK